MGSQSGTTMERLSWILDVRAIPRNRKVGWRVEAKNWFFCHFTREKFSAVGSIAFEFTQRTVGCVLMRSTVSWLLIPNQALHKHCSDGQILESCSKNNGYRVILTGAVTIPTKKCGFAPFSKAQATSASSFYSYVPSSRRRSGDRLNMKFLFIGSFKKGLTA